MSTRRIPSHGSPSPLLRKLADQFRPHAEIMAKAINYEIHQRADAEYARLLDGPFGDLVTQAIDTAVGHALARVRGSAVSRDRDLHVFRKLGEAEFTEGRDLTFLHTAYRVGGRVAWHHLAEFGQQHEVPAQLLFACADAVFGYVGDISALTTDGYQSAATRADTAVRDSPVSWPISVRVMSPRSLIKA